MYSHTGFDFVFIRLGNALVLIWLVYSLEFTVDSLELTVGIDKFRLMNGVLIAHLIINQHNTIN